MNVQLGRRPATDADVPFLLALRREVMDPHLAASGADTSEAHHRRRLMHHYQCAEVLLVDDAPAGLLKVRRTPEVWEIIQLHLAPRLQGLGLGRGLLEDLIASATAADVGLSLHVLKANPARRLYERLGFKIIDESPHDYTMYRPTGLGNGRDGRCTDAGVDHTDA